MVHLHDFLHRRQLGERLREEASKLVNGPLASPLERAKQDEGVATVFSVVYVTASASFTGPTAGFITQTAGNAPSNTNKATSDAAKPTTSQSQNNRDGSNNNNSNAEQSSRTSARVSSVASTDASTPSRTAVVGTPVQATRSATSAASASAAPSEQISQEGGMSGGAKAGVAFGVIAALALVAGIIFLVIRKKKQQKEEQQESHNLDNEKAGFGFAAMNHTPRNDNNTSSRAPRLSLRPVTQFLPGIGEPKVQEMTSATGGLNSFLPPPPQQQHKNSWDQPRETAANDAANPFGSGAVRVNSPAAERAAENAPIPVPAPVPAAPAANPFADRPSTSRSISPIEDSPLATAPNSPPKAEIGTAAAVAVGAAGVSGSPPKGPNNVHRVQLDFKPSMEDEIELRAGDVVRILHEYDDGWALCSRMDRSKQGVAPRTCLSKLPLKPRPAGPPPGMRPLNGRPESPGMRNFSGPPAPGHGNMYPAPLSPSMPNMSMTHGPQGRARAHSHSQSQSMDNGNRQSPQMMQSAGFGASPPRDHRRSASMGQLGLGGSPSRVPARKPVPGMAI
ncbi:hypothetical protein BDZ85DRAFT_277920 [Elsinoe ampelina]|uniref:SH3 domain-containing protein n=1 Tax=Elsinoe ampelina TaxID=302913 RepID=A0A6A6GQN9_9PEZI|nr:hypothetical protein BDZ85DRAFT_277920 [Elsinoe ampelina]